MSIDAKTALDEAAEKYAHQPLNRNVLDECKGMDRVTDRVRHIERTAFKAGAEWALKHSPEVLALVEALEEIREKGKKFAEDACMDWDGVQEIATEALAAFKEGKK